VSALSFLHTCYMSTSFSPSSFSHHGRGFVSCEIVFKIRMTSVEKQIGVVVFIMPMCRIMKAIIVKLPDPMDAEVNPPRV
jgi:hypothetical protein